MACQCHICIEHRAKQVDLQAQLTKALNELVEARNEIDHLCRVLDEEMNIKGYSSQELESFRLVKAKFNADGTTIGG